MPRNFMEKALPAILFAILTVIILASGCISQNLSQGRVCMRGSCFGVELAKTPEERATGLMYREHLDLDKGMLFVFPEEGIYPFWMKNTKIHLDIIWIDADKRVVFIERDAVPCISESCPSITPDKEAMYVLELTAGTADRIGIQVGDFASFEID